MSEILEMIERTIEELKSEGMNPDIMLAGPQFIEYSRDALKKINLKIYRIEELSYDAVIADSNYLGQIKKASRRVSVEPLLEEKEVWNELKKLDV
ncbi:family 4B encapsulin nanocompartment shell protein [Thermococcus stetteri]|uniref:family 4B encapsulin nanocompartment shell protein n=1 Tax=Thermococcus stetteri TaxID=49900 RepID=UPI001AE1DBF6|nr:family 4B encapsulin nanocompartment shell protein [Thermococcus stetteri]MBP1911323.1 hypothetical protein [Thermococcus stetteri]